MISSARFVVICLRDSLSDFPKCLQWESRDHYRCHSHNYESLFNKYFGVSFDSLWIFSTSKKKNCYHWSFFYFSRFVIPFALKKRNILLNISRMFLFSVCVCVCSIISCLITRFIHSPRNVLSNVILESFQFQHFSSVEEKMRLSNVKVVRYYLIKRTVIPIKSVHSSTF